MSYPELSSESIELQKTVNKLNIINIERQSNYWALVLPTLRIVASKNILNFTASNPHLTLTINEKHIISVPHNEQTIKELQDHINRYVNTNVMPRFEQCEEIPSNTTIITELLRHIIIKQEYTISHYYNVTAIERTNKGITSKRDTRLSIFKGRIIINDFTNIADFTSIARIDLSATEPLNDP